MSGVQILEIQSDQEGMRLDRWLRSLYPQLRQGEIEKLLRKGQIRVDGARAKSNTRLNRGQQVRIPPLNTMSDNRKPRRQPAAPAELVAQVHDAIIYQDNDILVLNKPAGLAVQGGSKTQFHLDGMLDELQFEADERPRLVHRLDRDTSGVMVLGRNRKATAFLTRNFADRQTRKVYWALTHGVPRPEQGDINVPLIKRAAGDGQERVRVAGDGEGGAMKAMTRFAVLQRAGQEFAWVAFRPMTGRTHQIRAHALAIGHPLVGDGKYFNAEIETGGALAAKLHLHSAALTIPHPKGDLFHIEAPLTGHMLESWQFLGFEPSEAYDPFPEDEVKS